jgi:hypothetical protein
MSRGEHTKIIAKAPRRGPEIALTVHRLGCSRHAAKTFHGVKLWNGVISIDVPKHRRFRLHTMRKPEREGGANLSRRAGSGCRKARFRQ